MKPATLKRFLRRDHFADLLELHRLDKLAADGDLGTYEFCLAQRRDLSDVDLSPPPLLTGRDLVAMGVAPGPRIGNLLEALETEQLAGRLHDIDSAREWVRARLDESAG
jgi:poly(A) polymerase